MGERRFCNPEVTGSSPVLSTMGCEKRTYPSKAQADKRAVKLSQEVGYPLFTYKCLDCGRYHLTSKKPAKRSHKGLDGRRKRK